MTNTYVGLTIRTEVLKEDDVTVGIEILKKIATEAMKYYYQCTQTICPEINIQKSLPDHLGIEEYNIKPENDLKIRLSLEPENYAPFNCWMEVNQPNSKEWDLLIDLAHHISSKFPELTFNVNSNYSGDSNCAANEKYTNLFKNGLLTGQLTRQEWVEKYLGTRYWQKP